MRAFFGTHDWRHRRHTSQLRHASRHVLQTLASSRHAKTVDELLRRIRYTRVTELLRRQTVAHQHQGVRYSTGLCSQRLDRLGSDSRRVRERRRKGKCILLRMLSRVMKKKK